MITFLLLTVLSVSPGRLPDFLPQHKNIQTGIREAKSQVEKYFVVECNKYICLINIKQLRIFICMNHLIKEAVGQLFFLGQPCPVSKDRMSII